MSQPFKRRIFSSLLDVRVRRGLTVAGVSNLERHMFIYEYSCEIIRSIFERNLMRRRGR